MSKAKRSDSMLGVCIYQPPPPQTPGEAFRRSDPTKLTLGVPRPFSPQHRFHVENPSQYIKGANVGKQSTMGDGSSFRIPNGIKTPCQD